MQLRFALLGAAAAIASAGAQAAIDPANIGDGERATGTFDVTIAPDAPDDPSDHPRMSMTKRFSGDLEATAEGTMLTVTTATEGSAVYVALERVTGSLGGRSGSFDLVHRGVMTRGVPDLSIMVVPDSGTDELAGLAGTMEIEIREGRHFYRFDYRLP